MSFGPKDLHHNLRTSEFNILDFFFVGQITASEGPDPAALAKMIPGMFNPESAPTAVLHAYGSVAGQHDEFVCLTEADGTMYLSWAEVADLHASIAALIDQWPEEVRIRYQARYDRSLASARDSWRRFKAGEDQ